MTALQILDRALMLLGYTDDGHCNRIKSRAIAIINAAYVDVCRAARADYIPLKSLSDTFTVGDEIACDVLVYGVAMFIAQSEGDTEIQAVYCDLYNKKRGSLAASDRIADVLTRG